MEGLCFSSQSLGHLDQPRPPQQRSPHLAGRALQWHHRMPF
ncbi:hypothetical protein T06_6633 [Trichinella sp. T6]|nr:hypothetical protein T06_6633 [Trichinella sp. T6]